MMRFFWPSRKAVYLSGLEWHDSIVLPGVRFAIRQTSLTARIELAEQFAELARKYEYLQAGGTADQAEGLRLDLLTRKLYLEWAVAAVDGLRIDGKKAKVADVIECGPLGLVNEMVSSIQNALELTGEERKN